MELIQLIYASDMAGPQESELASIVKSAARHNRENQVTGMLLYSGGNFMQVLEGEPSMVQATYARICRDPRHHNILLLLQESVQQRHFSRWSMGFTRLSAEHVKKFPRFAPYFQFGFDVKAIQAAPGVALDMLLSFGKGML
jgi:hypothetical protein